MNPLSRRLLAIVAASASSLAVLTGCTREVDNPTPRPANPAAPISELQVADLLSAKVLGGDGNLFVTAEPERCSGLAQEVEPPFLEAHHPLATDGGHWNTDDGATYVEEMVAVYRFDFDPARALDTVRKAIQTCTDTALTVTTMSGRIHTFAVSPAAESPQGSIGWSLRGANWNCDNVFVANHNAAIEITTCGATGGYDVGALADDALKRIDALANTTA
ncbi:MAG: sensor domain-containing protein [Actinomycetia bacterium]|nr:sensor domain-containing protein [Actinomycetes bacterium]